MKVIFLDFDGVLNSDTYYEEHNWSAPFIDESRLVLLKRIVDATDAKIVLSTSWKMYWEKDPALCKSEGKYINEVFAKYGMYIYDKTIDIDYDAECRVDEINDWFDQNQVDKYVAIDDMNLKLPVEHFVRTKAHILGIDEENVQRVISLLNEGSV